MHREGITASENTQLTVESMHSGFMKMKYYLETQDM